MARIGVDPSQRIARLKAAREMLPAGEILNLNEMAAAAGFSDRHLKPMIDADAEWPVMQRGSEGIAWQFDAHKVIDHMIRRAEEQLAERRARMARLHDLAGIEVAPVITDLSISEMQAIDRIQTAAQRRKIEQGRYVPRAEVERAFGDIFTLIQGEILSTTSRLDAAGQWPAEVREGVEDELRSLLVRLHDQIGPWIASDAGDGA